KPESGADVNHSVSCPPYFEPGGLLSQKKAFIAALVVVLLVIAVLPFRVAIRKAWRHANPRHEPSKGMLKNPEAMCFDKDGTIYVGNQDSGDIVVLNPDGSFR